MEEAVEFVLDVFEHFDFELVLVVEPVDGAVDFFYLLFDLHLLAVELQFLFVVALVHGTVRRTSVPLHFAVRGCLFYAVLVLPHVLTVAHGQLFEGEFLDEFDVLLEDEGVVFVGALVEAEEVALPFGH